MPKTTLETNLKPLDVKTYKTLKEARNAFNLDCGFDPFLCGCVQSPNDAAKAWRRPTKAAMADLGYPVAGKKLPTETPRFAAAVEKAGAALKYEDLDSLPAEYHEFMRETLLRYFPWLAINEDWPSAADQMEILGELYNDFGGTCQEPDEDEDEDEDTGILIRKETR